MWYSRVHGAGSARQSTLWWVSGLVGVRHAIRRTVNRSSALVRSRRPHISRRFHFTQTLRFLESWRWVVFYAIWSEFGPRRGRFRGRRANFWRRRRSAAAAGPTGPWHSRHRLDAVAGSRTPLWWFRASRGAAAAAEDTQTPSHRAPAAATPSTRVVARRGCRGWFLFRI